MVSEAMMGDILRSDDGEVTFRIDVHASSPIERIDVRNGLETVEVVRPYTEIDLGRRIRCALGGVRIQGTGPRDYLGWQRHVGWQHV